MNATGLHPSGLEPAGLSLLHVCTRYRRGGSERRIRDIVLALPEARHHLVVGADSDEDLARRQTGADRVWVLPALVRPVDPRRDLVALVQLRRLLRSGGYHAVVTHQSKAGALGRAAALAARGPAAVHSLSMASFGPGYGRAEDALFRRLERALGQRTAAFCVVGADLAGRFATIGVPPDRLHVVRSGVALPAEVRPREPTRQRLLARHGVPPDSPLLCYVGSLEPRKNVLLLADLLVALGDRVPVPPWLLVVGDGPQREALAARLRELGVHRQAVLTGHLQSGEHVADAMRGSDVVVLLSRSEGLPQVLVQAAAQGTPFVAFDVEGVRELVSLGAAGDALPLGDLDAVADAATRRLTAGPGSARDPVADLSSWSPEEIRAAYRRVLLEVLAVRASADAPPVEAGVQVPAQTRHVLGEQVREPLPEL